MHERTLAPRHTKEAMVVDKSHIIDLIIKRLHKCEDISLLDLIYKLLLQA